jgi:hypothetical protein
MSEWFEGQKKSTNNLRKLLQEQIDKANPRRQLTADEAKRLNKLRIMADNLKRGVNVQNRQLKTWLSEGEYAQVDIEWQEQLELREELKDKPDELKRYEDKLKEAIIMRNRADAYHRKGKKSAAYKLDSKCESLCEEALEILQEIVAADASLQIWFDRHLDFEDGSLIDASLGNLPRSVTSRSIEKLSDDSRLVKKIDVKISVVECAIYNIGRDTEVSFNGDRLMLEKFLNTNE